MWGYDGKTEALVLEDEWKSLCFEEDMSRTFVAIPGIRSARAGASKVETRCEYVEA